MVKLKVLFIFIIFYQDTFHKLILNRYFLLFEKQDNNNGSKTKKGKFQIWIIIKEYKNFENFFKNGDKCDVFHVIKGGCDPRFDLAIYE